MKKYFYIAFITILLSGCSPEAEIPPNQIEINTLLHTVSNKYHQSEYDHTTEYTIENGKVVSARFFLTHNPEEEHLSTYQYNENGKIEKEFVDGELNRKIIWTGNMAKVYTINDILISEFEFNNHGQIIGYKTTGPNGTIFIRKYNYGPAGNVVSIADEEGLFAEFLDYDNDLRNPLYLIHSIAVLNIYKRPHFKNMFKTEKVYPIEGDDYSISLQYYNYEWTLNENGLVETVQDELSVIYISEFQYN